jgi:hypothetical protein
MPVHPIRFGDIRMPEAPAEAEDLSRCFRTLDGLDRDYGPEGRLPLEGVEDLVAATLAILARIGQAAPPASQVHIAEVTSAVALWALNHELPVRPVEPVVNALAVRSNAARTPEAAASVFGLMERVILNVAPALSADLEKSDPQRPWRLLHANLAITAIRTADPRLMDRAFDALELSLPGEAPGFYAEALALALAPSIPAAVRDKIAQRHARATPRA